ncbi:MAG: DNA translocase FtsK 4TM domain-containing protein [Holosporaceae bacterium]
MSRIATQPTRRAVYNQPLVPHGNRWRLGFVVRVAVGVGWLLLLLSYHHGDPSLNSYVGVGEVAAKPPIHNWLGWPGAVLADLSWQSLGWVGILLPVFWLHGCWQRWHRPSLATRRLRWLRWGLLGMTMVALALTTALALQTLPLGQAGQLAWGGLLGQWAMTAYDQIGWAEALGFFAGLPPLMLSILGLWALILPRRLRWADWWVRLQGGIALLTPHYWLSWWQARQVRAATAPRVAPQLARGDRMAPSLFSHDTAFDGRDAMQGAGQHMMPFPSNQGSQMTQDEGEAGFGMASGLSIPTMARANGLSNPAAVANNAFDAPAPRSLSKAKAAIRDDLRDARSTIPPLNLLKQPPAKMLAGFDRQALEQKAADLLIALADYGVKAQIHNIHPGPVVTLFEVEPAAGVKASRVISLADDLARAMRAVSVRVFVLSGTNLMGVEIPNAHRETIYLREILSDAVFAENSGKLPLVLGKDIGGSGVVADLARMPHLLVAGTTGSGKSVGLNSMILSLLYKLTPEQVRFIMVDPKMLELSVYDGIPHLLTPVVTDPKKAIVALKWTVKEMENRYRQMANLGVRNIEGYNQRLREARERGEILKKRVQTGYDPETGKPSFEDQPLDLNELPLIVVVVDEMADLMLVAGKEIEATIQRLAQMARAAGIHLIMATQRPSVDVITGTIKANFPTRISFQVTSKIDSRTILAQMGAEQLLGQGDMLYMSAGGKLIRVHGPFVSDGEVEAIANFLRGLGEPNYLMGITDDEDGEFGGNGGCDDDGGDGGDLYNQAVNVILREKKASTSLLQRHLQIGYNRAAKLMDELEREGVVSPPGHSGKRQVLIGQL